MGTAENGGEGGKAGEEEALGSGCLRECGGWEFVEDGCVCRPDKSTCSRGVYQLYLYHRPLVVHLRVGRTLRVTLSRTYNLTSGLQVICDKNVRRLYRVHIEKDLVTTVNLRTDYMKSKLAYLEEVILLSASTWCRWRS